MKNMQEDSFVKYVHAHRQSNNIIAWKRPYCIATSLKELMSKTVLNTYFVQEKALSCLMNGANISLIY